MTIAAGMADRMCIVTREVKPEDDLIRFVRAPDGAVVPDLQRKLPGRGVWVSLDRQLLAEAVRRNLFSKAFGEQSVAALDLPDRVSHLLRARALSYLSMARKAGSALTGFMKVSEALQRKPVAMLFHATEASQDGCRKLDRLAAPATLVCDYFTQGELDLAFGGSNVVHAAIIGGSVTDQLASQVGRMARFDDLRGGAAGRKQTNGLEAE